MTNQAIDDKDAESFLTVLVLAIGEEALQAISALHQQYDEIRKPYLRYVLVQLSCDAITEPTNDSVLLLDDAALRIDAQGLPSTDMLDYLQRCCGARFQGADAIFIMADFSDKRCITVTSCLGFLLSQQTISHQALLISVVNEKRHFKPGTNREQFEQGLDALRQYCDTLIVNESSDIEQGLLQAVPRLTSSFPLEIQALVEVFSLFAVSFWYPGLIGVDFADIYPLVRKTTDSIFVSAQGVGEDCAALAANEAISRLQQHWGNLSANDISVLANVCGASLSYNDLEIIGDIFCSQISEIAEIVISTGIEAKVIENSIVIRVLFVKSNKLKS